MMIARISAFKRINNLDRKKEVLLINTVHDDIEIDVANDPNLCYTICLLMKNVFMDIPKNFYKLYGVEFNIPLEGEISFGQNLKMMKEWINNGKKEQFA